MSSTSDKISGEANELTGKAKQAIGDATDNRCMQAKGAAEQAKGDAQQTKGEAKDALERRRSPLNEPADRNLCGSLFSGLSFWWFWYVAAVFACRSLISVDPQSSP